MSKLILAVSVVIALTGSEAGEAPRDGPTAAQVPAARRPPPEFVPVVLVPGWADNAADLAVLGARLRTAGWPESHILAVHFARPTGSNREHARELAAAVDSLRARTGAAKVDIIAHSMGGLATRLYLQSHPTVVRRVVFLGTPHQGTWAAFLAFGAARAEMLPGSSFLRELNSGPPVPPGVDAFTVRTLLETHIIPGESATLPGVPGWTVCCTTHWSLKRDPAVFEVVRNFLRHGLTP